MYTSSSFTEVLLLRLFVFWNNVEFKYKHQSCTITYCSNIKRTARRMCRRTCDLYIERIMKTCNSWRINILNFCWIWNWKSRGWQTRTHVYVVRVNHTGERGYLLFWFKTRGDDVCFGSLDNIYFWEENAWRLKDKKRERELLFHVYNH